MNFELFNCIWIVVALATFLILVVFKIRAPYGRHSKLTWGPVISNKWGWFFMELPALILMPVIALLGSAPKTNLTYTLLLLWVFHYFFRTLIFPFQLKTSDKKMPLVIVGSAILFNGVNGFLNGYFLGYLNTCSLDFTSIHFIVGCTLFVTGMFINRNSDRKLIALREKQEGYQIPKGGLFDRVSCPNHLGEIIEWIGFAILAWNLAAVTFAVWTFCNLIPRALNHHAWYQEYFEDYPNQRKAVIPFIL